MLEKAFKFTGKDLTKLSIMMIMSTLLFGLPGLLMMLTLRWITHQSYALESADKHGISHTSASRLGGASIFGFSFALYMFWSYSEIIEPDSLLFTPNIVWLLVFVCIVVGLIDDLSSNLLSPRVRLIIIFSLFSICLAMVPELIPQKLD